jgi:hypothetical protein
MPFSRVMSLQPGLTTFGSQDDRDVAPGIAVTIVEMAHGGSI